LAEVRESRGKPDFGQCFPFRFRHERKLGRNVRLIFRQVCSATLRPTNE
jgi:hypothetical protein